MSNSTGTDSLETFGKFLMINLRDRAIRYCDQLIDCKLKAPSVAHLQTDLQTLTEEQLSIVRRCVVRVTDYAIHDFLFQLQECTGLEDAIQIYVNGINVAEVSDGLHGEPYTEDGWMARYSEFGEPPGIA
jgi:hypothetical protein